MVNPLNRKFVLAGTLLLVIFLISFIFAAFEIGGKANRTFLFPHALNHKVYLETRNLSLKGLRELNIKYFMEELLLGPINLEYQKILPKKTRINMIMLRDKDLKIDFSREIIFPEDNKFLTLPEKLDLVKRNLILNFPFLKSVEIKIEGTIPLLDDARFTQEKENQ